MARRGGGVLRVCPEGGGIQTRGWGSKGRNVTWALKATLCHGIIIILRLTAWYSCFILLIIPKQGRSAKSVAKKFPKDDFKNKKNLNVRAVQDS